MASGRGGKRWRIAWPVPVVALLLGILVVSAIAAAIVVDVTSLQGPQQVELDDLCSGRITHVTLTYAGNQTGYLSSEYGPFPDFCVSEVVPAGSAMLTFVVLHNFDTSAAHSIQTLSIAPPYGLVNAWPTLPTPFAADGNLTLNVTLQVPTVEGDYGPPSATVVTA